jgi:hypothetical protein
MLNYAYYIGGIMLKIALIVLIALLILLAAPLLIIWSLNTLFPVLAIPYALETWAAAVILGSLFSARVKG